MKDNGTTLPPRLFAPPRVSAAESEVKKREERENAGEGGETFEKVFPAFPHTPIRPFKTFQFLGRE